MNPEAVALFRDLADCSPAEREEYYARQRVTAALREEVESLLRFDRDTVDPLQQQIAAAAHGLLGRGSDQDAGPAGVVATGETRLADSRLLRSDLIDGRFPPGTLLGGRYRIVSLLGRGGMGEVYRATDLKLKQPVALKFLPEATARDPRQLARLHGEVRLARQISHPNVCRVYDIGELEGTAYLAMEYIDGEDLASLLRRIGRLPHDKALEISRRLCAGLAAAHDKGVVHRDLKPGNVMVDSRGQVFITDFGLASTARERDRTPVRSGTPVYMAPEQLAGREVSVQSDHALGSCCMRCSRDGRHSRSGGSQPTGRRASRAWRGTSTARSCGRSIAVSNTTHATAPRRRWPSRPCCPAGIRWPRRWPPG
jgi:serine/threonine protein kinase